MEVLIPPTRRVARSALARWPLYRLAIPIVLGVLALVMVGLLLLASGVLLGIVPYPGR